VALDAAARAIVTAADGAIALQGPGDLRRLETARAILDTEGRLAVPRIRAAPRAPAPAGGKVLQLVVPGEGGAAGAHLEADVVVAARLVGTLGARRIQSRDTRLRLRGGAVEVEARGAAPVDPALLEQVRRVQGVKAVTEARAVAR
jgi:hypothetical protein